MTNQIPHEVRREWATAALRRVEDWAAAAIREETEAGEELFKDIRNDTAALLKQLDRFWANR